MAVRFPEGFALTLFVLSRLILDHRTIVGCWPCSLPWQSWVVCSCVSSPFCVLWVPRPVQDLDSTPGPCPHSGQKPPSDTDHPTLHPFACFPSSLRSPAAYTSIITQLLMDHLMFISLIRMEAPLGITLLWFTACSIPSVHSPGT